MPGVSDAVLLEVIKDFLEMGHVDNIVAMFRQEPAYLAWSGKILEDERFAVRLGVSVLFEELKLRQVEQLDLAIPSLVSLLESDQAYLRGEALSVLAIIGGPVAAGYAQNMSEDDDPQVREIATDIIASADENRP